MAHSNVFKIMWNFEWFIVPLVYHCISVIPTSIDDQANHIKRKSNLIFGEAATTGLLKRKDERDITRIWDLKNKRMTDKQSDMSLKTLTVSQIFYQFFLHQGGYIRWHHYFSNVCIKLLNKYYAMNILMVYYKTKNVCQENTK